MWSIKICYLIVLNHPNYWVKTCYLKWKPRHKCGRCRPRQAIYRIQPALAPRSIIRTKLSIVKWASTSQVSSSSSATLDYQSLIMQRINLERKLRWQYEASFGRYRSELTPDLGKHNSSQFMGFAKYKRHLYDHRVPPRLRELAPSNRDS